MSKDWYARKFNTPPPAAPPAAAPQQARPGLQPMPGAAQTPESAGSAALARGDYAEAAAHWAGGEGTRTEHENCPNCGSANYFSRTNRPAAGVNVGGGATGTLITQNGRMGVAARCFECNYNGLYDLQG